MTLVPSPTATFWVEDTGDSMVWLRRYQSGSDCPVRGYHAARYMVGPMVGEVVSTSDTGAYAGDPRWPPTCECGYAFVDDDHWQVAVDPIMACRATGQMWPRPELPPGALYDAAGWYPYKGPDGISLVVICPPAGCHNAWYVDGPARPGDGTEKPRAWARVGDPRSHPPTVDITPSIEIGFGLDAAGAKEISGPCYYHGFLRGGVLTPGL